MKSSSEGFSLLELLVGMVIVTIGLSVALPSYMRNLRQGEVDRYAQQLEAGFFGLRAKLGQHKTSCTLKFGTDGLKFCCPADLLETKIVRSGSNAAIATLKLQVEPVVVLMGLRLELCWLEIPSERKEIKLLEIVLCEYLIARELRNPRW